MFNIAIYDCNVSDMVDVYVTDKDNSIITNYKLPYTYSTIDKDIELAQWLEDIKLDVISDLYEMGHDANTDNCTFVYYS